MGEHVFKLPDLGEGTVEAEIVEWLVQPGDSVREGQPIANLMTDKANVEVPAPVGGRVLRTTGQPGDRVPVGAELAAFDTAAAAAGLLASEPPAGHSASAFGARQGPAPLSHEPPGSTAAETEKTPSTKVLTSPSIRRRAKEQGIDLSLVPGTGPCGRILRKDLDAYLATAQAPAGRAQGHLAGGQDAPPVPGQVQELKLVGVRGTIARRMAQAKREIPHFTYVEEVDVTELEALRGHLNDEAGHNGLSLLPFVCFALLRALPEFPQCNAHYDSASGTLKRYPWVHLGIAVHTDEGLKVPVLKNAQRLDFQALAGAVAKAAAAARGNRLAPGELSGSTITVSSLGKLGGIVSTPIINYPEVAVVGVNRAVKRAAVADDRVAVRLMMNLSSSFDHRFIDGQDAASLIARLRMLLEHPALLFMAP